MATGDWEAVQVAVSFYDIGNSVCKFYLFIQSSNLLSVC